MKTLYYRHKWMQILFGVLFLAAGILIIVFALNNNDNISKWLSIVLAIGLFIFAASSIFSGIFSLKEKYFDPGFIIGDICIAIGVVLIVFPTMIGDFIVIFVGTLLTTIGTVFLGEAVAMIFFRRPKFSIASFFLLGAVFLALGILSYAFKEDAQTVIYVAVGAIMALVGVVQAIFGIVATSKEAKAKRDISEQEQIKKDDAVDVKEVELDIENSSTTPEIIDVSSEDKKVDA